MANLEPQEGQIFLTFFGLLFLDSSLPVLLFFDSKIIENNAVEVIVQKLEMILFTNKNEILGQEGVNVGADLEFYLWNTNVSNDILKSKVVQQINQYVPELNLMGYTFDLVLYEGTVKDIMELKFVIQGYNINFVF